MWRTKTSLNILESLIFSTAQNMAFMFFTINASIFVHVWKQKKILKVFFRILISGT